MRLNYEQLKSLMAAKNNFIISVYDVINSRVADIDTKVAIKQDIANEADIYYKYLLSIADDDAVEQYRKYAAKKFQAQMQMLKQKYQEQHQDKEEYQWQE